MTDTVDFVGGCSNVLIGLLNELIGRSMSPVKIVNWKAFL